jgi:hypothetical protein
MTSRDVTMNLVILIGNSLKTRKEKWIGRRLRELHGLNLRNSLTPRLIFTT